MSPVPGHRDRGGHHDEADRAQHPHPRQEGQDFLHKFRQSSKYGRAEQVGRKEIFSAPSLHQSFKTKFSGFGFYTGPSNLSIFLYAPETVLFFFQFSNVHVVSMVSQDYIFVFSLAALLIQVFEGERAKTKDNRYLHVEFFCVGLHTETCTVGYNALFAHLIGRKLMSMQI